MELSIRKKILPIRALFEIKAYSKPRMRFSGEYKQCVTRLNTFTEVNDWLEIIKKRLCDKDADMVIHVLKDFADARVATNDSIRIAQSHSTRDYGTPAWRRMNMSVDHVIDCSEVLYIKSIRLLEVVFNDDSMIEVLEKEKKSAYARRTTIVIPPLHK